MDDLLLGKLDFLNCILVNYKIQINRPGYDFLPKIILGAVNKSLNYSKKLQLYRDKLCKIPSKEDIKNFFKFTEKKYNDL